MNWTEINGIERRTNKYESLAECQAPGNHQILIQSGPHPQGLIGILQRTCGKNTSGAGEKGQSGQGRPGEEMLVELSLQVQSGDSGEKKVKARTLQSHTVCEEGGGAAGDNDPAER